MDTWDVIPAGPRPPNPQELFSGMELPALLEHLGQRYEAVILDGPAWTSGADALPIAAAGADAVLVARNDRTPLRQLARNARPDGTAAMCASWGRWAMITKDRPPDLARRRSIAALLALISATPAWSMQPMSGVKLPP